MHAIDFIQDLAIIMLIAGIMTILFHQLKQPVVLGYIIAGVIIGPHTPPFTLIKDQHSIQIFADLGVIFLMFSLGLEFSLQHLKQVGASALVAAFTEIIAMMWIGYKIGIYFHWSHMDALFLGAILAISSTTIIVKALSDLKLQKEKFAQLIFGILIVEDILGIAILALLSGIAKTNTIDTMNIAMTLGKLLLFIIVSLTFGIWTVPKLLSYVATYKNREMLLVSVLGLCFGFCLLVVKLNYNIVLGAFIIGAIVAESQELKLIEKLIEPLKDMFSAVFFVAVGMLLEPSLLIPYALPIIIISIAVIIGKVLTCGFGAFITGEDGKTSLKVGMGLAQIGEFSFIIAALGVSLKITSNFLYPIAVMVSAITTVTTPYLIKNSDHFALIMKKCLPKPVTNFLNIYTESLHKLQLKQGRAKLGGWFFSIFQRLHLSVTKRKKKM